LASGQRQGDPLLRCYDRHLVRFNEDDMLPFLLRSINIFLLEPHLPTLDEGLIVPIAGVAQTHVALQARRCTVHMYISIIVHTHC
jgi:hypothetical protein